MVMPCSFKVQASSWSIPSMRTERISGAQSCLRALDGDRFAGPAQADGVEAVVLEGEAHVATAENGHFFLVEGAAFLQHGRTFTVGDPGGGPINGFAVDLEPGAHAAQDIDCLLGQRAIGLGTYVEQQVTVLADVVHQVVHQGAGALVMGILEITPTFAVIHGRVRDPLVVGQAGHASQLQVDHAGSGRKVVILEGHHQLFIPLGFPIEVVCQEIQLVWVGHAAQSKVEPEHVGLVVVTDLKQLQPPALQEIAAGALLVEEPAIALRTFQVVQRPVETAVRRIGSIIGRLPVRVKPPVLGVVKGAQKAHTLPPDGAIQLTDHVAAGSHAGCIPLRNLRIPHRKAVVVFGDRAGILGAGQFEQLSPLIGIELFGSELGDEVLVAELFRATVNLAVIGILLGAGTVHVVRVPGGVGAATRHAVDAPVGVDAELGVLEPLRGGMGFQRVPGGEIGQGGIFYLSVRMNYFNITSCQRNYAMRTLHARDQIERVVILFGERLTRWQCA